MDLSSYLNASFLMSFFTMANVLGALGGACYVASISMRTIIPLRIAGIASAFFFLCSGILSRSFPAIFLYAMLLPLNSFRLYQLTELIKKVRAANGPLSRWTAAGCRGPRWKPCCSGRPG